VGAAPEATPLALVEQYRARCRGARVVPSTVVVHALDRPWAASLTALQLRRAGTRAALRVGISVTGRASVCQRVMVVECGRADLTGLDMRALLPLLLRLDALTDLDLGSNALGTPPAFPARLLRLRSV
jgi:hypothetical protein